ARAEPVRPWGDHRQRAAPPSRGRGTGTRTRAAAAAGSGGRPGRGLGLDPPRRDGRGRGDPPRWRVPRDSRRDDAAARLALAARRPTAPALAYRPSRDDGDRTRASAARGRGQSRRGAGCLGDAACVADVVGYSAVATHGLWVV